jgi:hypothetical protein
MTDFLCSLTLSSFPFAFKKQNGNIYIFSSSVKCNPSLEKKFEQASHNIVVVTNSGAKDNVLCIYKQVAKLTSEDCMRPDDGKYYANTIGISRPRRAIQICISWTPGRG